LVRAVHELLKPLEFMVRLKFGLLEGGSKMKKFAGAR
jgi:hypothetical protein